MLKASKHEANPKIRFPYRDVKDDDVDRPQVYRQQCHSRAVLIARMTFFTEGPFLILESSNTRKKVFESKELYDIMLLAITM